jgi:hypothetical protein
MKPDVYGTDHMIPDVRPDITFPAIFLWEFQ